MQSRVDGLLGELASRHKVSATFTERLRPVVERILDDETPEDKRPALLELVAETCEREVNLRKTSEELRRAFRQLFQGISEVLAKLALSEGRHHRRLEDGAEGSPEST